MGLDVRASKIQKKKKKKPDVYLDPVVLAHSLSPFLFGVSGRGELLLGHIELVEDLCAYRAVGQAQRWGKSPPRDPDS